MGWPQVVFLMLVFMGFGADIVGFLQKQHPYFIGRFLREAVILWLVWMGGFFS